MRSTREVSFLSPNPYEKSIAYYNSTYAVLLSFGCWVVFYFSVRYLFPEKRPEWSSRVVTLFHGVGSAINGLSECFLEKHLFEHIKEPLTENQQIILVVSLGYFMQDLFWCLYHQTESKLMLSHHVFSVCALYRMLWKDTAGPQTVCAIGGMEVTNPILQIRWFLREEGFKESKWFTIIEVTFIIIFFLMRVGFGTYFFINVTLLHPHDPEYIFMTFGLYLISLLFVANIVQYMYVKYSQEKVKRNSSVVVVTQVNSM